jgi:hypothetical protein
MSAGKAKGSFMRIALQVWTLTQLTEEGGHLGDFAYPLSLGHFLTETDATAARAAHIQQRCNHATERHSWTNTDDYRIDAVSVHTKA